MKKRLILIILGFILVFSFIFIGFNYFSQEYIPDDGDGGPGHISEVFSEEENPRIIWCNSVDECDICPDGTESNIIENNGKWYLEACEVPKGKELLCGTSEECENLCPSGMSAKIYNPLGSLGENNYLSNCKTIPLDNGKQCYSKEDCTYECAVEQIVVDIQECDLSCNQDSSCIGVRGTCSQNGYEGLKINIKDTVHKTCHL